MPSPPSTPSRSTSLLFARKGPLTGHTHAFGAFAACLPLERPALPRRIAQVQQALVRREVVGMNRCAAAAQVIAARHQQRPRLAQGPGDVGVGRRVGVADRQVEAFLRKVDEAVRQVEFEPDVRKGPKKSRQHGRDVLAAQRHRRRDADQPARRARQVLDAGEALLDAGERPLRLVDQLLPRLRQPHRPRGPPHQRHARRPLQLGDAHADRRLGHAQSASGLGVAAGLGQHREQVQV